MKIIGGSFGTTGKVRMNRNANTFAIKGTADANYRCSDIQNVDTSKTEDRRFSVLSFLLGIFILTPILTWLFNVFGLVAGIVISIVGSYVTKRSTSADVIFFDGKRITLQCSKAEVNELVRIANG